MQNWPSLKFHKELRGFLGLTAYYHQFVRGYGSIAQPLTNQLKKNGFCWSPQAKQAFFQLKQAMSSVLVLALPDFNKPFVLEIDAFGHDLGAVPMQDQQPIAFFSHTLSPRAQQKSVYERELMAIVLAVQKLRHYLLEIQFIVRADQGNLKYLLEQRIINPDYHKLGDQTVGV